MFYSLVKLSLFAHGVEALYHDENHHWQQFNRFKQVHSKSYKGWKEENAKFKIFRANMKAAAELQKSSKSGASFGPTKFSDMAPEEFKKMLGYKPNPEKKKKMKMKKMTKNLMKKKTAQEIDWRSTNVVTPVKDQELCGACWAFSVVEQLESAYALTTGRSVELSTQQLVECDKEDHGCEGGNPILAYEYLVKEGGIERDQDMPYISGGGSVPMCRVQKQKFAAKVEDYYLVAMQKEHEENMYEVIQHMPMSVCVDATTWPLYAGGIVDASTCRSDLNHCVQAVGISLSGQYWILRNSWGPDWGENGHIRVRIGQNACGVAEEATIAEVTSTGYGDDGNVWDL